MADPVPTVVEPTPVVVAPEPIVEPVIAPAPVVLTDDETATQQAAAGAPGTPDSPVHATTVGATMTDEQKGWVRANARWLMAELDWTRAGRTADERETLNP